MTPAGMEQTDEAYRSGSVMREGNTVGKEEHLRKSWHRLGVIRHPEEVMATCPYDQRIDVLRVAVSH